MLKAIAKKEVNCNRRVRRVWKKEANAQKFLRKARQDIKDNKVEAHILQHFKQKDIKSIYEIDALKKMIKDHQDRLDTRLNCSI